MATKVRKHTDPKKVIRFKRKKRIRGNISGTAEKPRLSIFKSNSHLYAQIIDDNRGVTVVSASTLEKENKGKLGANLIGAKALGALIAERAKQSKVEHVVFDRSGYLYHGKIKAFADAAREAGLKF